MTETLYTHLLHNGKSVEIYKETEVVSNTEDHAEIRYHISDSTGLLYSYSGKIESNKLDNCLIKMKSIILEYQMKLKIVLVLDSFADSHCYRSDTRYIDEQHFEDVAREILDSKWNNFDRDFPKTLEDFNKEYMCTFNGGDNEARNF